MLTQPGNNQVDSLPKPVNTQQGNKEGNSSTKVDKEDMATYRRRRQPHHLSDNSKQAQGEVLSLPSRGHLVDKCNNVHLG